MGHPRYRLARAHKVTTRSAGNLTLNSTNWANVDTGLDITLAAQAGDVLEASLSAVVDANAVILYLDVVTVVSAAPVNSFGKKGAVTAAPLPAGVSSWYCAASVLTMVGAPIHYTAVAGDLASGLVTLRLRYATATATNRILNADSNVPVEFCVKNLGPADGT